MDASVPTGEPATPSGSSSSTGNTPFSFFAFGDAHAGQDATTDQTLVTAAEQMAALDPSAALAFSNGDLVEDSADGPWKTHDQAMQAGNFDATLTSLGTGTPYFAAMDNHDRGFPTERMDWLDQWTRHLPGQQALGHTAKDGVYYSFSYAGVLFIVLDSIHPSQAQNDWLISVLEGPDAAAARVKLAFFHEPVYSCITDHPPFADGLPWVDTFETHGVKLVFVSHEHTYNRTCAMYHGACSEDAKAVVYQELGPLGAQNFRPTASGPFTASGKDASGAARSDTYSCTGDGSILLTNRDNINDFCHVSVDDCNVHGDCYIVGTNEAFDSWDVKACP
jgi:hypothetical protein